MKKNNLILIFIISIILLVLFFVFIPFNKEKEVENKPQKTEEILSKNQGKLWFISDKTHDTLSVIDIEVADDEAEREQGLMYRQTMNADKGMLFIFDNSDQRFFWMKNTFISLDIIYVDENMKIVTIHKTALPQSETSLPSIEPAKYVVEVNAGFTDRYKINKGDKILFIIF